MDRLALDEACQQAFRLIDATNEHITVTEPWALARDGHDRTLDGVLWQTAEALRIAAVLLAPVMPQSVTKILGRLGAVQTDAAALRLDSDARLATGGERRVTHGEALWPRLEPAAAPATIHTKETPVTEPPKDLPGAAAPPPTPPTEARPADTRISIEDFLKIDLRVARVVAAARVPNSKKLITLDIDLGAERRTIVAGIAEAYEAEALVGRLVAVVANLKPAKLMGIESNGMVLAASPEGGTPILLALDQPAVAGTRIR
jgi:methionyl-tRNA synthetase